MMLVMLALRDDSILNEWSSKLIKVKIYVILSSLNSKGNNENEQISKK